MKVWIDVGGTFTDCFVSDLEGGRRRGKVLSSGVTKGMAAVGSDRQRIIDVSRRGDARDFWVGFELTRIGDSGEPLESRRVAAFDSTTGTFTLETPFEAAPATAANQAPRAFELRSDLEAPVLAVRRLLGLPLSEPLPPMEVRLGTTRGTNALLTRSGAAVALVTTRGFGDLLRIGSQERPDLFALDIHKPLPLTETVLEIDERLDAEGRVLRPLDEAVVRRQLEELRARGAESLAIGLLHAYRNDVHERAVERLAREIGFAEVSVSSEVVPLVKLLSRAETTVLDAYLNPILAGYIGRVWEQFGGPAQARLRLMTSGGQLVGGEAFRGRDSILSGPAGGVVALAAIGRALSEVERRSSEAEQRPGDAEQRLGDAEQRPGGGVIGFDMGGTSTDVSRFEGRLVRQFESRKAGVRVMTPMMAIHTVAAGGGSVCYAEQGRLHVGPESAGSDPGPACYGRGGPLTVTDLNLLLGRVVEAEFPFPLDRAASLRRLDEVAAELARSGVTFPSREALAEGFWQIAVNHMAEAIRTVTTAEGADPRPMSLVGFGGAAGQHACAVAGSLGMRQVLDHSDAAMLSALGMGLAAVGRSATRGLYQTLETLDTATLDAVESELRAEVDELLAADLAADPSSQPAVEHRVTAEVRYAGTETTLELPLRPLDSLAERFAELHRSTFGYARAHRSVELVTLRLEAEQVSDEPLGIERPEKTFPAETDAAQPLFIRGEWTSAALFERRELIPGAVVDGPAVIAAPNSTLVVEPGWQATLWPDGSLVVTPNAATKVATDLQERLDAAMEEAVQLEIVARRLEGIAEQMGEVLRRTSVSVNVKERLDYSCAVFRADGSLVAGAMHVPVHLGAMGHTVRSLMATYGEMFDGDCYVSNDPYAGGSHLPDLTVVTPVFVERRSGRPDFFVASRAHHAEIGGITPGSMPPRARSLAEEGVVIRNFALVRDARDHEPELAQLLTSGPYPSRTPQENLADIAAQVAAGRRGAADLVALARQHGCETLSAWMTRLLDMAADSVGEVLRRIGSQPRCFVDHLDDGTPIAVRIQSVEGLLQVDFEGTGAVHPHGWNATPAIVSAAVLYVLRCLAKRPLPLSEGVLQRIDLRIPSGLLNPPAAEDPARCPAVVAGNVETSQRVVDALLGALGAAAASQGTMNNLLIGDATFGYYETICGGAGATAEASGADAVHTHMTNTRITDPEILESRYPIRLWRFAIRRGSGGGGRWRGGDGVIRELEMLRPLTVSLLTGRRGEYRPYGIAGGQPGAAGQNRWTPVGGSEQPLPATVQLGLQSGDRLTLETPGGGGWGAAN